MFDSPSTLLAAAFVFAIAGMAWLALGMEVHWQQVQGNTPLTRSVQILLRVLGTLALAFSLGLCMEANHVSMAALVWIMLLATGAALNAFLLTWKARFFAPLVAWLPCKITQPVAK